MSLPFQINYVPDDIDKELKVAFPPEKGKFVQAGPKKCLLSPKYMDQAAGIYNLELRPDDVWVVTYPRSGTTWTQELVWLINNDLDYDRTTKEKQSQRFPFIEGTILVPDNFTDHIVKLNNMDRETEEEFRNKLKPCYEKVAKMDSPRHIKTHLPFSLLPPKLLATCKVVYVARNPKDVAVSSYHQARYFKFLEFNGDFEKYWDLFQRGIVPYGPFWSHVEEAWRLRNNSNILFLFYEDMKKDLPAVIRRVAEFLNKSLVDEQIAKLVDQLSIESFRNNPAMKDKQSVKGYINEDLPGFFRQGESGTWRKEFTPELNAKADEWIREHEKRTDFRFQF